VVLVEGGTVTATRRPASGAFAELAAALPPLTATPEGSVRGVVTDGPWSVASDLPAALEELARRWRVGSASEPGLVLVGLGRAEVGALNAAARRALAGDGRLSGPSCRLFGREYRVGDRVVLLRRGVVAAGAVGQVTAVDPAARRLAVDWGAGTVALSAHQARSLTHAYATTPGFLRRMAAGRLLVLGHPQLAGLPPERILTASVIATTSPPLGPSDLAAAWRAELRALVERSGTDRWPPPPGRSRSRSGVGVPAPDERRSPAPTGLGLGR